MVRSFSIQPSSEDQPAPLHLVAAPSIPAMPSQLTKPTAFTLPDKPLQIIWRRNMRFSGRVILSSTVSDAFIAVFDPLLRAVTIHCSIRVITVATVMKVARVLLLMSTTMRILSAAPRRRIWKQRVRSAFLCSASFQGGGFDGFVAKIDTKADGNPSLTYSTYFGGNINDRVESVAVDQFQRAYITGASNSSPSSFPLKNAFDSTQTNGEAFVAKLNADGTTLFYCSFLGGNNGNTSNDGEEGLGLASTLAEMFT